MDFVSGSFKLAPEMVLQRLYSADPASVALATASHPCVLGLLLRFARYQVGAEVSALGSHYRFQQRLRTLFNAVGVPTRNRLILLRPSSWRSGHPVNTEDLSMWLFLANLR